MNYYLYFDTITRNYYVETPDWHETFASPMGLFTYLGNHMGPGDTLHWVR